MKSPFEASYSTLRARSLSQFNNWPLYQSVLRHQLARSVHPQTAQLAGELEEARIDDVSVLKELTSIYETSSHTQTYYDKHPGEKLRLSDVYRFEVVLRMHKHLLEIRDELPGNDPISVDKLRWIERIINDAGWVSGNFGITELAGNIASVIQVAQARNPSPDLVEAGRILNQVAATSAYHDTELPISPNGFSRRLLTGGIEMFARMHRAETIDEALLGRWAKSIARSRIIPDIIKSNRDGTIIPTPTLITTLNREWKHYNEYLIGQYSGELRKPHPEIASHHHRYTDRDENYSEIYIKTWDAYELIYGLERAAATLGNSNSALAKVLGKRFFFLTRIVNDYVARVKRGEKIHSGFNTSTTRLSETPELEEIFVLAKTLGALAPNNIGQDGFEENGSIGRDAFDFLHNLILDEEIGMKDRGYVLWRIEDLFDTTTQMGMHEFTTFSAAASSANTIAMEPQMRQNLAECETFSERVAYLWAQREVDELLRKIQDVDVDPPSRAMAIQRLRRFGAAAAKALPVFAEIESALPPGFDLKNDPMSSGAHALFKKSRLTPTILLAREASEHIQGCMQMKGWR